MNVKLVRIALPLLLIGLLCSQSFGVTITVSKTVGIPGDYPTIGQALTAADALPGWDPVRGIGEQVIIEVQDSGNYSMSATATVPGLTFPADQNGLILRAAPLAYPIITLTGTQPRTKYIKMQSSGQVIQGFTINLTEADHGALGGSIDSNSTCITAVGGGTTVQDCIITGPCVGNDPTLGYVNGLQAIANITSCDISQFRNGIVCDLNDVPGVGFNYTITNSLVHNNHKRGIIFGSVDANMIHSNVYANGNLVAVPSGIGIDNCGNIICDGNELESNKARVKIEDSNVFTAYSGRNVNIETTGEVWFTNCKFLFDKDSSYSGNHVRYDNILMYGGTAHLTGCLLNGSHGCLAELNCNQGTSNGRTYTGGTVYMDHCTVLDDPNDTQWGIYTLAPNATINVKNSIFAGNGTFRNAYGMYQGGGGTINTSYNDVWCSAAYATEGPAKAATDRNENPQWINTNDPATELTYYAIQPYSPERTAGEGGTYMGWKDKVDGYERYPADYTYLNSGTYKGVNFRDFALFAQQMGNDGRYTVDPNVLVATDGTADAEGFVDTGTVGQAPDGSGNPYVLGHRAADTNNIWWVTTYVSGTGYQTGSVAWTRATGGSATTYGSRITLITPGGNDANSGLGGTKNIRWEYSLNPHSAGTGDPCYVTFTEIQYLLPHGRTFKQHNTLRVMMKRAAGNTPSTDAFMYARFMNIGRGSSKTLPDKGDICRTIIGGDPATHAGQWYAWQINMQFDPTLGWGGTAPPYSYDDWGKIGGVIFGVRTQDTDPYDAEGTGTIDIDTIQLSTRACDPSKAGQVTNDLNSDCMINFGDVHEFAYYWLMGEV